MPNLCAVPLDFCVGVKSIMRLHRLRGALLKMRMRPLYRRVREVILASFIVMLWLGCAASQTPAGAPSANPQASTANLSAQAQAQLRSLIEAGTLPELRWPNFTDYRDDVRKFYQPDSLAWIRNNRVTPQAVAMIQIFKQALLKGLNPEDYDASRWDARLAKIQPAASTPSDADLVRFDLALTVCAMRYISGLHNGRINPQRIKFSFDAASTKYDLPDFIRSEVLPASNVNVVVAELEPQYSGYQRAEAALAAYTKLAAEGDGRPLPIPDKGIRPGKPYAGMAQLVWRLCELGDLSTDNAPSANAATPAKTATYDGAVVDAVKRFQVRHGLQPDGVLGKGTIAQLKTPLSIRVQQLQLTLERYRWLPPGFPQPPIVVNIPEFRLHTMRRQPAWFLTMKVVVGKAYHHHTPVFANYMRYLIFRPYWEVPLSIQRDDLIPKIVRDRNYLAKNDYEVVDSDRSVVADGTVSDDVLSGLRSGSLNIRQKPGPKNALGLVKFMFPNVYNVYLHGTPAVELFSKARRDFSHGCIRVEDPVALAAWVLRDRPEWDLARIQAVMNGDQTMQVNLKQPIPVLIIYSTAVVEPDGDVRFFQDIYGDDTALKKVLAAGYPFPVESLNPGVSRVENGD
jgi:murein L,D-transpeptidase YcbB/YkuD